MLITSYTIILLTKHVLLLQFKRMAKINLKKELQTNDDRLIVGQDGKSGCTLGFICRESLMSNTPTTSNTSPPVLSMEELEMRGKLHDQIKSDPEVDLKAEQIVLLKRVINEAFRHNIRLVLSAFQALES